MDRLRAWFTPQMVVAAVAAVFTGVGAAAACVQLAEGHGYYAGWLWGPLQWLPGPPIHLLVVALLLVIWAAVWKWRGRLVLWARERYVRALVWLSRPVSEDLARILGRELGGEEGGAAVEAAGAAREGEPALAKREYGDEIAKLSTNASYVLFLVLKTYAEDQCQQVEVTLWAAAVRCDLWGVGDPLSRACRELLIAQLLTDFELSNDEQSLRAVLADRLADGREVPRFMELLEQQLRERYFWDSDDTAIP
jgi:hypothetical protein